MACAVWNQALTYHGVARPLAWALAVALSMKASVLLSWFSGKLYCEPVQLKKQNEEKHLE